MLSHLFNTMRGKNSTRPSGLFGNKAAMSPESNIKSDIDELYSLSRKGLWSIFIFLAASALALHFQELTLSGSLPAGLMDQLGPTPPVILVNIVLGISTICSLIVIAGRILEGRRPGNSWIHLSFRLFFFILYFISNALNDYFYVIFISGLAVLALQHYNVWNYCSRAIDLKTDVWGNLTSCDRRLTGK
jgi:hypothetical protein